jgi:mannose-6-phosphate isomerase-like protein (cupin superfamily)
MVGGSIILKKELFDVLLQTAVQEGKRELEPLKSFAKEHGLPLNILEDTNFSGEIEIHNNMADLWYCLQGEVTFTLGGEPFEPKVKINKDGTENPNEIRAGRVVGGEESVLTAGDWLWIPPGVPHAHRAEGTVRLVVIKFPSIR